MHDLPLIEPPVLYRSEVLERLRQLGVAPGETTQPGTVYQLLRALMTFEIREAKARRRELEAVFGPQPLDDYAQAVAALREKYSLLRRPLSEWLLAKPGNGH